jgi:hypothetical protein
MSSLVYRHYYNDFMLASKPKGVGLLASRNAVIKRLSAQVKRLREVRQGILKHGPDCRCHDAFFFNLCSGK